MASIFADHVHGIDHLDALHGAEIYGRAVGNFFASQNRAFHNVVDVGPIAELGAIAPHFEGRLMNECASDHRDHSVIFHPARPVHGEVTAGRSAQPVLLVICLQRKLRHQLGPAVSVIGVVRSVG